MQTGTLLRFIGLLVYLYFYVVMAKEKQGGYLALQSRNVVLIFLTERLSLLHLPKAFHCKCKEQR